jgi:hypothetical protein
VRFADARCCKDRMNGWGLFDALSVEGQQRYADTSVIKDINGYFLAYDCEGESDRALPLSEGDMGPRVQLSARTLRSQNPTAAPGGVTEANMYRGDDCLHGVQATENHAVLMLTIGVCEPGGHMGLEYMRAGNSGENRQFVVDDWDAHETEAQSWVPKDSTGSPPVLSTRVSATRTVWQSFTNARSSKPM